MLISVACVSRHCRCLPHAITSAAWRSLQALEEEQLGPRREPYSDERQKRLAVQEAATALICTLMPAIEPVTLVRSNSLGLADAFRDLLPQCPKSVQHWWKSWLHGHCPAKHSARDASAVCTSSLPLLW